MASEKKVKEAIKAILKARGIWYFMPSMNGFGRAGVPDFIACYNGRFIAIEAKAAKNGTTKKQEAELEAIAMAGGMATVVRETTLDQLEEWLDAVKPEPPSS